MHRPAGRRFNEAAARCRGKLPLQAMGVPARAASMRPRPDAAENGPNASPPSCSSAASMRPRPDAAENRLLARQALDPDDASMRPRPDAAENIHSRHYRSPHRACRFNEAAARCRGKHGRRRHSSIGFPPRFNEAAARCRGKRSDAGELPVSTGCFNEAAARCRGKRCACWRRRRRRRSFNEAAARCRGKPGRPAVFPRFRSASMRPRPDAAENAAGFTGSLRLGDASMRPRPDAAENLARTLRDRGVDPASMRPRPDAAENGRDRGFDLVHADRFNEAAARCRGKRAGAGPTG